MWTRDERPRPELEPPSRILQLEHGNAALLEGRSLGSAPHGKRPSVVLTDSRRSDDRRKSRPGFSAPPYQPKDLGSRPHVVRPARSLSRSYPAHGLRQVRGRGYVPWQMDPDH